MEYRAGESLAIQRDRKQPTRAPDAIANQLNRLRVRDLQLWSIAFLTMLVLALGVLCLIVPNMQGPHPIYVQFTYLPQLATGLIALIILLNLYLANQRRRFDTTRIELIRESAVKEVLQQAPIFDPETQLLDRRYLEYIFPVEMSRANRTGVGFSLMLIESVSLSGIRSRMGMEAAGKFLLENAHVLKNTFRGSDTVLCYDSGLFLIVMPATDETQGGIALRRLIQNVDDWNLHTPDSWEMLLECRLTACPPGTDAWTALRQAEGAMNMERSLSLETLPSQRKQPTISLRL